MHKDCFLISRNPFIRLWNEPNFFRYWSCLIVFSTTYRWQTPFPDMTDHTITNWECLMVRTIKICFVLFVWTPPIKFVFPLKQIKNDLSQKQTWKFKKNIYIYIYLRYILFANKSFIKTKQLSTFYQSSAVQFLYFFANSKRFSIIILRAGFMVMSLFFAKCRR